MTILNLVPGTGGDLPSRQISRRIRGIMAEHRVTGVRLAEAIGMNQKAFSRRYADQVDWSVDEIAQVARVFGMTFAELVAVDEEAVRHQGLEPRTRWLTALPSTWPVSA
jgi:hypothetical protein